MIQLLARSAGHGEPHDRLLLFLPQLNSDPSSSTEFSDILYKNDELLVAISNSLTDKGILVAQVGEGDYPDDPPEKLSRAATLETSFIPQLELVGFEKIKKYEDMQGGFGAVWNFLIAFKNQSSMKNWYANEALVSLKVAHRIIPTKSGESSLRYFDGAQMNGFAYPSKTTESVFCLRGEKAAHCDVGPGFDPERTNVPISSLAVKERSASGSRPGVLTKIAIQKGSYIALEEKVHSLVVFPEALRTMKGMQTSSGPSGNRWKIFQTYLFEYGLSSQFFGDTSYIVDSSKLTFLNHGCNGSNNIGTPTSVTEVTADPHRMPSDLLATFGSETFNAFVDRQNLVLHARVLAMQDVTAGEEITDNFLHYLHEESWEWGLLKYRSLCESGSTASVHNKV